MKLKTEICDGEEAVVIYCRSRTDTVRAIENAVENLLRSGRELMLRRGDAECYVPIAEILFFETGNGKVFAHTKDAVYTAEHKLFALEELLPSSFVRVSKSAIVNIMQISSLQRGPVGNGEIAFKNSPRKTWFSRGYYHILKDKIEEMRLIT